MIDTDRDLDLLQDLLDTISPEPVGMSVAAFDGYVAALIACPETVMPSEWLPGVLDDDHVFEDTAEAEAVIAAAMGYYNRIARELAERPEEYAPVLGLGPDGGEVPWEPWIGGFERAMRLRPDAWEEIALTDDEEASASVSMIVALNDMYHGRSELTEEAEEDLDRLAPGLIPEFVRNLNARTASRQQAGRGGDDPGFPAGFHRDDPPAFGHKVGRNEPCHCGSGRKHNRCCGAH